MTTSMNTAEAAAKAERVKRTKVILAVLLGLVPLATMFLPYVRYAFSGLHYNLSALQLLTLSGLSVNGTLVPIPLLAKVCVGAGILFGLLGSLLLLLKKPMLSGISFAVSAITPLIVLLTSSQVQTALTSLNISQIKISYLLPFTLTLLLGLLGGVLAVWTKGGERLAEAVFLVLSLIHI